MCDPAYRRVLLARLQVSWLWHPDDQQVILSLLQVRGLLSKARCMYLPWVMNFCGHSEFIKRRGEGIIAFND